MTTRESEFVGHLADALLHAVTGAPAAEVPCGNCGRVGLILNLEWTLGDYDATDPAVRLWFLCVSCRHYVEAILERTPTKPATVLPMPRPDDAFGSCPVCGRSDGYLNIGREQWFYCRRHRTRWCAGENLMSSWHHETEDTWRQNAALLSGYQEVEPAGPPPSVEAETERPV